MAYAGSSRRFISQVGNQIAGSLRDDVKGLGYLPALTTVTPNWLVTPLLTLTGTPETLPVSIIIISSFLAIYWLNTALCAVVVSESYQFSSKL